MTRLGILASLFALYAATASAQGECAAGGCGRPRQQAIIVPAPNTYTVAPTRRIPLHPTHVIPLVDVQTGEQRTYLYDNRTGDIAYLRPDGVVVNEPLRFIFDGWFEVVVPRLSTGFESVTGVAFGGSFELTFYDADANIVVVMTGR